MRVRAVTRADGGHFFANAPELVPEARRKISRPLYSVLVRIASHGPQEQRTWEIAKSLAGALSVYSTPLGNELIPLDNDQYDLNDHIEDTLQRRSCRSGMILNSDELISLIHFPSPSVRSPKLKRLIRKSKAVPDIAARDGIALGANAHNGETKVIRLNTTQRVRHMHVIGASGTGKSTFLLNLIQQDIENGDGVAVLDPHGDLIDQIISRIPDHRLNDVILFDPSDEQYPIGFNILSAHSDLEKNLLASDLVAVFRRLPTSWGDQMTSVLGNGILAFLESSEGGTLADLRRFLVEPSYRSQFLNTVQDSEVVYYWQKEFPLLTGKPQGPLLTRLDAFLRPKTIRYMVGQKQNRLNFAEIMNGKQILLAKLSQGVIGEENSFLLGSLLVSKIHQTVMGRQEQKELARQLFYLYVDEFHHFVTPSMASLLTGARKYGLGLILAHQEINQLQNRNDDVASAVISNPYTRVCFRLGDYDARKMADGFSYFDAKDLQNLSTGEAICRVERGDFDFNLRVSRLPEVDERIADQRRTKVIAATRERYGTPRQEVEEALADTRTGIAPKVVSKSAIPSELVPQAPAPKPSVPEQIVVPSEPAAPKPTKTMTVPQETMTLGRGGQEHKYLQHLIKQWAEGMGYRTTIEKPTPDGLGSVDVALERGDQSIACEITISTEDPHEFGNIQKCLKAGYQYVMVICRDAKRLEKLRKMVGSRLEANDHERVQFFIPENLFTFLTELQSKQIDKEQTVRGYKVKTSYRALDADESKRQQQIVSQTIANAMKRLHDRKA